jgi:8-oxo-dGTP pyrophosphatase MutT (NUDIX family)
MDLDAVGGYEPHTVDGEDREAAVIAPLIHPAGRPEEDRQILFTKRADHLADHPGQMSFPGGGHEPDDDGLLRTALREANEEVGLDPHAVNVVGRLDDIRTISRYAVRPFVARIPDRQYQPTDDEVAEVVALPVSELLAPENYESQQRDHPYYGSIRLHFFYVDGYTVWGATARMLAQLLELTTGWEIPTSPDRVAGPEDDFPEAVRDQIQ